MKYVGGAGAASHSAGMTKAPMPPYSLKEEIANAVSHGLGVLLSLAGLVLLVTSSTLHGNAWHIVACTIFGVTLVLLYTTSTLYHALPRPRSKQLFRKLDHGAIFLLIAGTYTPFLLVNLRGAWGWSLLVVVWVLAIAGVILKFWLAGRFRLLSTALYLVMGWLIVVAFKPLLETLAPGGVGLLVAGGLAYTAGSVFYLWRRLPYHHAVWHLFVLGGSICHFFAVFRHVVPHSS